MNLLFLLFLALQTQDETPTFGTTVYLATGLRGDIYFIPPGSPFLPNFKKIKPVGSIYTNILNIPIRNFRQGFPGVTDRFEWFAIDYNGSFWIEKPGKYQFGVESDDGSRLWIDGHQVVENDGIHGARAYGGNIKLKPGLHKMRLAYFQGPGSSIALILAVIPPGEEDWKVFDFANFRPPKAK